MTKRERKIYDLIQLRAKAAESIEQSKFGDGNILASEIAGARKDAYIVALNILVRGFDDCR